MKVYTASCTNIVKFRALPNQLILQFPSFFQQFCFKTQSITVGCSGIAHIGKSSAHILSPHITLGIQTSKAYIFDFQKLVNATF